MNQRVKLWTLLQQNYKINFELISQVNALITVKLIGGAKKSFSTDKIVLEKKTDTINDLVSHLIKIKPKNTLEFDTKNLIIAVNGVDSSALDGYDTKLNDDDEISIVPIIHGGSTTRIQFSITHSDVEIFDVINFKKFHKEFLGELRSKYKQLIIQTINPQFLLNARHAKKILDERVVRVSEFQQFKKELDSGKMIDCSWCGNQTCEDKIKEETGADLRVIPSDNTKAETCIYCKNSCTTYVLFARGY